MKLLKLLASLLISYAAAAIGSLATIPNIPSWYAGLHKPFFNPPDWVFGPVWSLLYTLVGISLFLLWGSHTHHHKQRAYWLFAVQIVLNAAWSLVFFGLHQTWLGLVVIVALLASIIMYIQAVKPVNKAAAYLMVPYLAWVTFATCLNAAIALLN